MMRRRDFLKTTLGSGAMLLLAACGSQPAAPAKPAESQAGRGHEARRAGRDRRTGRRPSGTGRRAPPRPPQPRLPAGRRRDHHVRPRKRRDRLRSAPLARLRRPQRPLPDLRLAGRGSTTHGKIIPWLAEKWETAADGKAVTFSLRKDVKYHDGSPFDAESVKWNIDRYRLTDDSARKGELAPLEDVQVVDASTVKFVLKSPFTPLALAPGRPGRDDGLAEGGRGRRRRLHPQGVQGRDRAVHPDRGGQGRPHHPREEPGLVGQGRRTAAGCRWSTRSSSGRSPAATSASPT